MTSFGQAAREANQIPGKQLFILHFEMDSSLLGSFSASQLRIGSNNEQSAFSFVSADSFGSVKVADDFLTGVVSPEGLVLSRNQILFDVSETSDIGLR